MISRKTITDITRKIAESLNPEKIILFGSYAWGKPDKDSDLDLFVIMESTERPIKRATSIRDLFKDLSILEKIQYWNHNNLYLIPA